MAYVDAGTPSPAPGSSVDMRGKAEPFEVVALPFYKRQK